MKKQNWRGERGAIMLEVMIVMVITLFVLIWILGLGFVYYQRYITTVVTNDAATKIASTYNNIDSDIIMGYVNTEALTGRNLYRRFSADTLHGANEDRAAAYVRYILDKANFVGVVDSVDVELELVLVLLQLEPPVLLPEQLLLFFLPLIHHKRFHFTVIV